MPGLDRVFASLPSLHRGVPSGSARFRSTRLVFELRRYYAAIRLPVSRLPPLLIQLVGHTRAIMIGVHSSPENFWASLVALMTAARSK